MAAFFNPDQPPDGPPAHHHLDPAMGLVGPTGKPVGVSAAVRMHRRLAKIKQLNILQSHADLATAAQSYVIAGARGIETVLDLLTPHGYDRGRMALWAAGAEPLASDRVGPHDAGPLAPSCCLPGYVDVGSNGKKNDVRLAHQPSAGKRAHPMLRLCREMLMRRLVGKIMLSVAPNTSPHPDPRVWGTTPEPDIPLPLEPSDDDDWDLDDDEASIEQPSLVSDDDDASVHDGPIGRPQIYDAGGSHIRWRRVLNDLLRIGVPFDALPRIHVQMPYSAPADNTALRGSTHDAAYAASVAMMEREYGGVFTSCACVSSASQPLCQHHNNCTHCVMIDSIYYLPYTLSAYASRYGHNFYSIHHEYYTPSGTLINPDGNVEMEWVTDVRGHSRGGVLVDVERGRSAHSTGMREWEYGPHWNPNVAAGFITTDHVHLTTDTHSVQPLDGNHAYVLAQFAEARHVHALCRNDAIITTRHDLRSEEFRHIHATSTTAFVHYSDVSGHHEAHLIPVGAYTSLSQLLGRGVTASAFPNAVRQTVLACSAVPPQELERSVAYLMLTYPMWRAYHDNYGQRPGWLSTGVFLAVAIGLVTIASILSHTGMVPSWALIGTTLLLLFALTAAWRSYSAPVTVPAELASLPEFGPQLTYHCHERDGGQDSITQLEIGSYIAHWTPTYRHVVATITHWLAIPHYLHNLPKAWQMDAWARRHPTNHVGVVVTLAVLLLAVGLVQDSFAAGIAVIASALLLAVLGSLLCSLAGWHYPLRHAPQFSLYDALCRGHTGYASSAFIAMGDDSLVCSASPRNADAFMGACAHTGHAMTLETAGHTADAHILSAMQNPMAGPDGPLTVLTNLPGRSLAKSFCTAKVVPARWRRHMARAVALCNLAAFGHIPILGSLWVRVLELTSDIAGKRIPPIFLPDLWRKNGTLDRVGRAHDYQYSEHTLLTWANKYALSISSILEADYVASQAPSLDVAFMHPVCRHIMAHDTEYKDSAATHTFTPTPFNYTPTLAEELCRAFLLLTSTTAATVGGVALGALETYLTGSLLPILFHGISGVLGATYGLPAYLATAAAHVSWNVMVHGDRQACAQYYTPHVAPQERACVRRRPEAHGLSRPYDTQAREWPDCDVEPTARVRVRHGNRALAAHDPSQMKVPTEHASKHGRLYTTTVLKPNGHPFLCDVPEPVSMSSAMDLDYIDGLPCGPDTPTISIFGPHTGVYPEVERTCVHGMIMALAERRLRAQTPHVHQLKFAKVCRLITNPLRVALRSDHLLTGPPDELYDWWVSRPQFSETQRRRLRVARQVMLDAGWLTTGRNSILGTKTFLKLEVLLKRLFKSRAITCMEDAWNILVAPAVQRAALIVGDHLQPNRYRELPGAPRLELVWLKGGTAAEAGALLHAYVPRYPHAIGTDGVMWDGSHTMAQLHNVDVFSEFFPAHVRLLYSTRRHEARSRVNVGTRKAPSWVTFCTSLDGTLFTGQPDVSLSNTLLRLCIDVYAVHASQ